MLCTRHLQNENKFTNNVTVAYGRIIISLNYFSLRFIICLLKFHVNASPSLFPSTLVLVVGTPEDTAQISSVSSSLVLFTKPFQRISDALLFWTELSKTVPSRTFSILMVSTLLKKCFFSKFGSAVWKRCQSHISMDFIY